MSEQRSNHAKKYLFPTNTSDGTPGAPDLMVQVGHSEKLSDVAFSPDGRQLITSSTDHAARLWDVASGLEIRCLHGHTDSLTAVAWSPDGRQVITGSEDNTVRVWDPRTGAELAQFTWEGVEYLAYSFDGASVLSREGGHVQAILWNLKEDTQLYLDAPNTHHSCAAYSPTRHEVITGNHERACLWSTSGELIQAFPGSAYLAAFSADGNLIALAGAMFEPINVWTREGEKIASFMTSMTTYNALFFLPDNQEVLAITTDNAVERWDLSSTDKPVQIIKGAGGGMLDPSALSPDFTHLVRCESYKSRFEMVNLKTAEITQTFEGEGKTIWRSLFNPAGDRLVLKNVGIQNINHFFYAVWDMSTGAELFRTNDEPAGFINNGELLIVSNENTTSILAADTGSVVQEIQGACIALDIKQNHILTDKGVFNHTGERVHQIILDTPKEARLLAVSPDLKTILYGHDGFIWLWSTVTGSRLWDFHPPKRSTASGMFYGNIHLPGSSTTQSFSLKVCFTPDGKHLIIAGMVGGIRRFDVETGDSEIVAMAVEMQDLGGNMVLSEQENPIEAMALLPNSTGLLVAQSNSVSLWDLDRKQGTEPVTAHTSFIRTLSPVPGKAWVLAGAENTAQLVDLNSGQAIVQLISFNNGTWVVIDYEGRFDTNNLEEIRGIHWVMPDDPMQPLPLEIFMRNYFEPRLLTRLLNGEVLPSVPDITQINRLQPAIRINAIIPHLESPEDPHASISITVESVEQSLDDSAYSDEQRQESEVWDLHVFRDGQLIALVEGNVLDTDQKRRTIQIEQINLPRTGAEEVIFSAYAFNKDRVKSQTARITFKLPTEVSKRKGRAYLISTGVNTYEDPSWNLSFAVNDAKDIQASLSLHLAEQNEYDVIPIQLISDDETSTATQAHFKAVIDKLAGRPVDDLNILKEISDHEQLAEARPEDLVFFSFAGHGFTGDGFLGEQGAFYFLLSDIGNEASPLTQEVLDRTLSSETLTQWLIDVDAGDMIFIIDACHSAASVEGAGFKPGPMGSRGLGQMAYNKGMLIMAASAADDVALESDSLEQGLLTYVLIEEGLNKQKADFGSASFTKADATIKLQEWLQYGAVRVPELCKEILAGKHRGLSMTRGTRGERKKAKPREVSFQQPAVFNYRKKKSEIVLWARDE